MRKNYLFGLLLGVFLSSCLTLTAQCPQIINAGDDVWACEGPITGQLHGNIAGDYLALTWLPAAGLSSPLTLNPNFFVTKSTNYVLTAYVYDVDLAKNGNFELGPVGFTSDYTYSPGDLTVPEAYDVLANAQIANPALKPCPDYSKNGELMLALTGTTAKGLKAWCNSGIPVKPNSLYNLRFYTTWLTPGTNIAGVGVWFNSDYTSAQPIPNPPSTGTECKWNVFNYLWDSQGNTTLDLCIQLDDFDPNEAIAIDEITFRTTCYQTDTVAVNIVPQIQAFASPSQITVNTCNPFTRTLNGAGSSTGPNIHYQWDTPDGNIVSGANTLNPVVDAPGEYTLTVSFDNGVVECSSTASTYVQQTNPMVAYVTPPSVLNCKTTSMILLGQVSPSGPYTYQWTAEPGGNITSATNLPSAIVNQPGVYNLLVTNNNNGCTAETAVIVQRNITPPVANATAGNILCSEQQTTLSGAGSSVGPNFSYHWSTPNGQILSGADSLIAQTDTAGTYILQVTNSVNFCVTRDTVVVSTNLAAPVAVIQPAASITCLKSHVTLFADSSSTGAAFDYAWTASPGGNIVSGADSTVPVVNAPGWYYLVVTNTENGCTATDSIAVSADTAAVIAIANAPALLTCTATQVPLDANGSSAIPGLTYQWSTLNGNIVSGGGTPTPTVNAPGTYQLLLTNPANGCTATDLAVVAQNITPPPVGIAPSVPLNCTQPTQTLQGQTGTPAANFSTVWSAANGGNIVSGAGSLAPVIDAAGTYTLQVTDLINGCKAQASVGVQSDFVLPGAALSVSGPLNCNNATVALTASSTANPGLLSHAWTDPDGVVSNTGANPVLAAAKAGQYQLVVTNTQNGCTSTASAAVLARNNVEATLSAQQNISCFGALTGSASVTAAGGDGAFTYLWNNNATAAAIANLAAGTYTVTVTDGENCTATATAVLTQPAALAANASTTAPTLAGGNDGTATANPAGGVAPYSYTWDNNATTPGITGLTAGAYTVTVQDANGCTVVQTVQVGEGGCNLLAAFTSVNPSCNGLANGQATINLSNGADPLTYLWSSGGTAATETNLPAGTHTVTATDAAGCQFVGTVELTAPPALTLAVDNVVNTTCANVAEGIATAVAAGGAGDLSYLWSDGQAGPVADSLLAGVYVVTVTDANGCSITAVATVQAVDAELPVITASAVTLPLGPSGSVTLTLLNLGVTITDNCGLAGIGILPENFDCDELGPHDVLLSAVDGSGNASTTSITVTIVDATAPTLSCPSNISRCFDDPTVQYLAPVATDNCLGLGGQFNLTSGLPSGSTFPPGTTTNTYTFTDASGNVGTCSFDVTILSPLTVALDTIVDDIGNQKIGGVNVTVGGSQPGYTFTWTLGGQTVATTEDLAGVGMGLYTLVVTDANGCTATAGPYEVTNVSGTNNPAWMDRIGVFPNPTPGKLFILLPNDVTDSEVQISVSDLTGRQVLDQQFSRQKQLTVDLSAFAEGVYTVVVRIDGQQGVWKVVRTR